MVLKLDPRIPMVWRDPFSLQFGIEPARVVLREVTTAQERMIAALRVGVSASGLDMVARAAGSTERDAAALLTSIEPVLQGEPSVDQPLVALVGSGPTVDRIAGALTESGVRVTVDPRPVAEGPAPDFGIAVTHYVFEPDVYGHWLRRDVPHLPVVFADGTATVGPLVEPGSGPCLYCIEFHRRDADGRWSALASQLWGRRSGAETPLISREVAAMAARAAIRRLDYGAAAVAGGSAAASQRIDVESGAVTRTEWMPHPDCGCGDGARADPISGVRRGIDSPGAAPLTASLLRPMTATAGDALA